MDAVKLVTCIAPVNIAVVKYWGKRDEKLIIPVNDSLSGTLSTDQMCAKTTIAISSKFSEDRIWLNNKEEDISNPRIQKCLAEVKKRAAQEGKLKPEQLSWKIRICSENNFPTAAGLASSAAGYACLAYALARLYELDSDISTIARQGSGSACRSVYGGFVAWYGGHKSDGSDSVARQVVSASYWPQMHIIILVVSDNKKKVSSTTGMQDSVKTSDLLKYRASHCVPKNMATITKAITDRDFHTFAEITMKESNQLHAVCLDTYPPCVYMNDVSHAIANLIHTINSDAGTNVVAYTFDAGPNACLYVLQENVAFVHEAIKAYFPNDKDVKDYHKGIPIEEIGKEKAAKKLPCINKLQPWESNALRYIIHTKIGEGPKVLDSSNADSPNHLLNMEGLPKKLSN